MPPDPSIGKVLVIGSGPIVIGQAAEFDYSGTQACRALSSLGIEVVLVNSNPATIQTSPEMGWRVYLEPLTERSLLQILERERPDALLPTMGGQTGLNLGMALSRGGHLRRLGIRLIGSNERAIEVCESRALFKEAMEEIEEPVPESFWASSAEEALERVRALGLPFPVVVRAAFALGGSGGGIAWNPSELVGAVERALKASGSGEVLVERALLGWKEIEFEVMRDGAGNSMVVCAMENLDPMGVHTGDSVVVAPTQTLSDGVYQRLRSAALRIVGHLGIEGGCNVQFAVRGSEYRVIEVNPRVSRSSALASKATGYPIARVAAQVAVGLRLTEIESDVVKGVKAFFEPALDYVVVKIPRWPFDRFYGISREIGVQMRATGEAMAIGGTFEEALFKAISSLDLGRVELPELSRDLLRQPSDLRLFAVLQALRRGLSPEVLSSLSGFDPFFVRKMKRALDLLEQPESSREFVLRAKRMGFEDGALAKSLGMSEASFRELREGMGVRPAFHMVDSCAGEFEATTPYFYSTYWGGESDARPLEGRKVLVLGSGPIRIGQGIEFDCCCVECAMALRRRGIKAVMVNNNPETVSTDFDASDRLYFEPLTAERVLEVASFEGARDLVAQMGGQTALNLALELEGKGLRLLGTSASSLRLAEDRALFASSMEELGLLVPPWGSAASREEAFEKAISLGFPLLLRPSFVIGGAGMEVVRDEEELREALRVVDPSPGAPLLMDRFLEGAVELDVDVVFDGEDLFVGGILEHLEEAGIHSGDSFCAMPPFGLGEEELEEVLGICRKVASALEVRGLLNLQLALKDGTFYVLEANPRASRTVPFVSKVLGLSLVDLAVGAMLGERLRDRGLVGYFPPEGRVAVKGVVFPFERFPDLDPLPGPRMQSTGEVIGLGSTLEEALLKAFEACGRPLPSGGSAVLSVCDREKPGALFLARRLASLGFEIYATEGTRSYLALHGLKALPLPQPLSARDLAERRVGLVVNVPADRRSRGYGFSLRRAAVEGKIPLIFSLRSAELALGAVEALLRGDLVLESRELCGRISPSR